jgi:hypothetical protein
MKKALAVLLVAVISVSAIGLPSAPASADDYYAYGNDGWSSEVIGVTATTTITAIANVTTTEIKIRNTGLITQRSDTRNATPQLSPESPGLHSVLSS